MHNAGFRHSCAFFGQLWYIQSADGRVEKHLVGRKSNVSRILKDDELMYVSATAQDIIPAFNVRFGGNLTLSFNVKTQMWCADETTECVRTPDGFCVKREHENMHEAAAGAYLSAIGGKTMFRN